MKAVTNWLKLMQGDQPRKICQQADRFWDTPRLFTDLHQVKQKRLTACEKEYVCALLIGYSPHEIAEAFNKTPGTVRGAVLPLYRYVEALLQLEEKAISSQNFAQYLRDYQRGAQTALQPTIFPAKTHPLQAPPPLTIIPDWPEGQVGLDSTFYVERPPAETRCYEMLAKPGSLIRIKAPHQMGKTSLLSRVLHQAAEQGHHTVSLNLQAASTDEFASLDRFLQWLCAYLSRKLHLPIQVGDAWNDIFGSKMNCSTYFEDYLLSEIDGTLTLGLDELDCIFDYPYIVQDFLGLLRTWHEDAKSQGIWRKLQLVLVHSTEVYVPLDASQSPFNVGLPIELQDFTPNQVIDLAQRHNLNWNDVEVQQLMAVIGGHPFLTRLSLYHLARRDLTLENLRETAATEAGLFKNHLRQHLSTLQQHPELAKAMQVVVASSDPVRLDSVPAFKLYGMGLVQLDGNEVYPRYELYRRYFCDRFRL